MGKPIIGITGNFRNEEGQCTLALGYYKSIVLAGGIPVIIPSPMAVSSQEGEVTSLMKTLDGLILSGGGDIDPELLGEEPHPTVSGIDRMRDELEIALVREAYNRQVPMLGICKGAQVIDFALGGKLFQDIGKSHSQEEPKSIATHNIKIEKDSILYGLFGKDELMVNSFHHQAIKEPAPCLKVTAMSEDGIIEAVESNEMKSILGVQWHPEGFWESGEMKPIFDWFVGEAMSFSKAKKLHSKILSLDSHCDTPMIFDDNHLEWNIRQRNPHTLMDLVKMDEGHLDATIMVAYLKQEGRDEKSLAQATAKADRILSEVEKMAQGNIAYNYDDLWTLKREGKRAIMLGIENGYAIGKDISNVEKFRRRGVVYMTLCHNGDNDICDSARGNSEHHGVSQFGEQVIKEMNHVGMMVDLSHASEDSFYDAIQISQVPIVCSHSSASILCDHPRNLTDDQMRALAKSGGVAQVTFYHGFLKKDGEATIIDAVNHLNHMVDVMGISHVGIGSDFDGDGGVRGLASAAEMINFPRRLMRKRYSEEDLRLIWGENFLRIMNIAQNSVH